MKDPMIENADEKLREICVEGINKKYDEPLKRTALRRLEQELAIVAKQETASDYLRVINAYRYAQIDASELIFCGTAASSILSYAAGLSDLEPINCIPRLYSEFFFSLRGEKHPGFGVRVTKEIYDRLLEYFENYPGPERITKQIDEFGMVFFYAIIGEEEERETREILNVEIVSDEDTGMYPDKNIYGEIVKVCAPKTEADHVKCMGLTTGMGTWRDNAESLIREGAVLLRDLITCREDVYEYLMEHGVEREAAFRIAEYVRKGGARNKCWKGEMFDVMRAAHIPEWYIRSCEKIKYLNSRATVIQYFRKHTA